MKHDYQDSCTRIDTERVDITSEDNLDEASEITARNSAPWPKYSTAMFPESRLR